MQSNGEVSKFVLNNFKDASSSLW